MPVVIRNHRRPEEESIHATEFVEAERALTWVGGVKSYEVAMYLVENLYGKEVAQGIASGLLIDWDRTRVESLAAAPRSR